MNTMDAKAILSQVRDERRYDLEWATFPLLRGKVVTGIIGWIFGIVLGALLLALIAPNVVPYNYQRGAVPAVITTVLLAVLLFIVVGSIWMMVTDIYRLSHADQYLIVITDQEYIKQEGKKITQVPLESILHVTARGRAPIDRTPPTREENTPNPAENLTGFLIGRNNVGKNRRRRSRTPSSLAFVDTRTNKEVVVSDDDSYGNPYLIGAELKRRIALVEGTVDEDEETR